MTRASAWHGNVQMGIGWGLFVGDAGDAQEHAHHALQVLLSDSPQWVWTGPAGRKRYSGLVIGADVIHSLERTTAPVALLYVEPHSLPGRYLAKTLRHGLCELDAERVHTALHMIRDGVLSQDFAALVSILVDDEALVTAPDTRDALMAQIIDALPAALPDRLTGAQLAAKAGLSESRFLHRFRAHTGLPLRPYLRWRRLLTAMTYAVSSHSLTDAAVAAGFADAAHFTRTFRRHFGIAPSTLFGMSARG